MHKIFYKPGVVKKLKKFTKQEKDQFIKTRERLRTEPELGEFLTGSLRGHRKWKFRVFGVPYRIIYRLEKERIIITAVGKRKDFYELLER